MAMVIRFDHPLHDMYGDLFVEYGIDGCVPYVSLRYMTDILRLDSRHLPALCDETTSLVKQYVVDWLLERYDEYNEHWFVLCRILPIGLLPPGVKEECILLALAERFG